MSDISALSHDYESAAQLAAQLNDAVLALKRSKVHPGPQPLLSQREDLAEMICKLHRQLDPLSRQEEASALPLEIVERLSAQHQQNMSYFLEDLSTVAGTLKNSSLPLDELVARVLDEICDAADATASSFFRRLRRR